MPTWLPEEKAFAERHLKVVIQYAGGIDIMGVPSFGRHGLTRCEIVLQVQGGGEIFKRREGSRHLETS